MSVLACGRRGCEHIMCSKLVDGQSYICSSCYEELIALKSTWGSDLRVEDVKDEILKFMETPSPGAVCQRPDIDEEFFRLVRDDD